MLLPVCVLVLGLFIGEGLSISCEVDSNNNCKATCNGTILLDISEIFSQYPQKVTLDASESDVGSYFLFSPCTGITCKQTDDFKSAVCRADSDGMMSSCGQPGTNFVNWELISTNPYKFWVTYQGGDCDGTLCQQTNITFVEDAGVATIEFSDYNFYYNFQVSGKCIGQVTDACKSSESKQKHKNKVGIIGLVLILLLILGIVTYFIVGIIVMKFYKGAEGTELIPNYSFWFDLPFLIKDGCLFVISPCYKRRSSYENLY